MDYLFKELISLNEQERFQLNGQLVTEFDLRKCSFDFDCVKIPKSLLINGLINRYQGTVLLPESEKQGIDYVFADEFSINLTTDVLLWGKIQVTRNRIIVTYMALNITSKGDG